MEINETALMAELRSINTNVGAILSKQDTLDGRLTGLHDKVEKHLVDPNAHGVETAEKAVTKASDGFIKWATLIITLFSAAVAVWAVFGVREQEPRRPDYRRGEWSRAGAPARVDPTP